MTYTVDPTDPTTPTDAQGALQGAEELRALKGYIATLTGWGDGINIFRRNLLINGDFRINQRLAATNADDTYCHDRWYALTQSNPIAITSQTDMEDGFPYGARLTQSNAAAQRMGYAQIIEAKNCKQLRGKTVTFKISRVQLSVTDNIRMAILGWTGAADGVTSDVVNNWASAAYTAGNFFLAANVNPYAVSGAIPLVAGVDQSTADLTVAIPADLNNLIVFVWTENTVVQNVTLDLTQAQLEVGSVSSPYEFTDFAKELEICQRYYSKSWALTDIPRSAVTISGSEFVLTTVNLANNFQVKSVTFPTRMRTNPNVNTHPLQAPNNTGRLTVATGAPDLAAGSATVYSSNDKGFQVNNTSGGAIAPADGGFFFHWTADAEL